MGAPIDLFAPRSGAGSAALESSDWRFHLWRCAHRGFVGCCDCSRSQDASRHAQHPIDQTFERGEEWFRDYQHAQYGEAPPLASPQHQPIDQPVPAAGGSRTGRPTEQLH